MQFEHQRYHRRHKDCSASLSRIQGRGDRTLPRWWVIASTPKRRSDLTSFSRSRSRPLRHIHRSCSWAGQRHGLLLRRTGCRQPAVRSLPRRRLPEQVVLPYHVPKRHRSAAAEVVARLLPRRDRVLDLQGAQPVTERYCRV